VRGGGGGGGGNGSVAGQQELPSNATLGSGHWVAALEWAIPGPSCVDAITLANYSCTTNASCTNAFKGLSGYTCLCNEGYSGDGYKNGSGCTGTQLLLPNLYSSAAHVDKILLLEGLHLDY
jgi:hypothetical protein